MFRVASATTAARRSGSSQNLAAQVLPNGKSGLRRTSVACNPPWPSLVAAHWQQYLFLAIAYYVVQYTDSARPFQRVIYRITDAELWRYSYPLVANQVPAWVVPLLSMLTPLAVVAGHYLAGRIPRLAAHHAVVQAWAAVVITGLITNLIKLNVGRPRPDFAARCWPGQGAAAAAFGADGVALCTGAEADWVEGLKSFPSGHTAWSAAGLGYTSLWLLGAFRCFDGAVRPARLALALTPACLAAWIGMTRLQDYWHHTEDVLAGAALGAGVAWMCYRAVHCPLTGPAAGQLLLLADTGVGGGAPCPSSDLPLGGASHQSTTGMLQGPALRYSGAQGNLSGDEAV